jgi:hypothetical protein
MLSRIHVCVSKVVSCLKFSQPKLCRYLFSTTCALTETPPSSFVSSSHLHFVNVTNFKFLIIHFSSVCQFFITTSLFNLNPLLWETKLHIILKIKRELRQQTFQVTKANYMGWSSWDTKLLLVSRISAEGLENNDTLEAKYKTLYFTELLGAKRKIWKSYFFHISWGFFVFLDTVHHSGTLLLNCRVHKQREIFNYHKNTSF